MRGPFTREGGYTAARALLARGERPTCVFAVTDVMAVGALAAFRERGERVPEDISLAGFDDIPLVRDSHRRSRRSPSRSPPWDRR
ncbi:HTH-type transcriptional repressor PurR [Streptomyces hirsutus]